MGKNTQLSLVYVKYTLPTLYISVLHEKQNIVSMLDEI